MELILNLLWLLLIVPAVWLWQERRLRPQGKHPFLVLLSLGCLLVLLFPVISASDDLQAMRMEAEDPITRNSLRDVAPGRSSQTADHQSPVFGLPEAQFVASLGNPAWGAAIPTPTQKPGLRLATHRVGRSPPLSSLEAR